MEILIRKDWRDVRLTKDFPLGGFFISKSFPEIAEKMYPDDLIVERLYNLCVYLLQPTRDRFGVVLIMSAYRNPQLNYSVGGVWKGDHSRGTGVDYFCPYAPGTPSMGIVYRWTLDELNWLGELIWYKKKGHIHGASPRFGQKIDQFVKDA